MHADGLTTLLVGAPLLLVLVAAVLRVDEHLFTSESPKEPGRRRLRFGFSDEGSGEVVLTDPDGRPFGPKQPAPDPHKSECAKEARG